MGEKQEEKIKREVKRKRDSNLGNVIEKIKLRGRQGAIEVCLQKVRLF